MPLVFLSYARKDDIFAQLAQLKLAEAHIRVWSDAKALHAGEDWRQGIEQGILDSDAVLVVLSVNSAASAYVTYEWAYTFGKQKEVIPIKLTQCELHPRLDRAQYLDFSDHNAMRWDLLTERLHLIKAKQIMPEFDRQIQKIFDELDRRADHVMDLNRLRERVDPSLTDKQIEDIAKRNEYLFELVKLADGKSGIAIVKATK
jgi:hypothetical protein